MPATAAADATAHRGRLHLGVDVVSDPLYRVVLHPLVRMACDHRTRHTAGKYQIDGLCEVNQRGQGGGIIHAQWPIKERVQPVVPTAEDCAAQLVPWTCPQQKVGGCKLSVLSI